MVQDIRDRLAFNLIKACLQSDRLINKVNLNTFWSWLRFQTEVEQLFLWVFDVVFLCRRGMSSRRSVLRGNGRNALTSWRRNIREQSFRTRSQLILFTRRISYRWVVFLKLLLLTLFFFQVCKSKYCREFWHLIWFFFFCRSKDDLQINLIGDGDCAIINSACHVVLVRQLRVLIND